MIHQEVLSYALSNSDILHFKYVFWVRSYFLSFKINLPFLLGIVSWLEKKKKWKETKENKKLHSVKNKIWLSKKQKDLTNINRGALMMPNYRVNDSFVFHYT